MAGKVLIADEHTAGLRDLRRTVRVRLRRQATNLAFDYSHVERVRTNATRIAEHLAEAEDITIDGSALDAACLLHEIGRGAERRNETLLDATLRIAEEMLRHDGLGDLVFPVLTALSEQMTAGRNLTTAESRVLHDADLLEDLGAIGLARTLAEGVFHATPLMYDAKDPLANDRDLDANTYLLDRLPARHFDLPKRFVTPWGRDEAERRARVLAAYYKAFFREAGQV